MYILVDSPPDDVNPSTIKEIIHQAQKRIQLVVHPDDREERLKEWTKWFKEHGIPKNKLDGPKYRRMFSERLQQISSSSHSALLSEYTIMDPTSFYKKLLDFPPTEIRDTYTLVKNIDGLIGEGTSVTIFDKYLLKHNIETLTSHLNSEEPIEDLNPLNSLRLLMKSMSNCHPAEISIYSEFFQRREYERIWKKRKSEMCKWNELFEQGSSYREFVRSLMKNICAEIRKDKKFDDTDIHIYDCSPHIYTQGKLPHDRYLSINRIHYVSTGGFNFNIQWPKGASLQEFTNSSVEDILNNQSHGVRLDPPTKLIPVSPETAPLMKKAIPYFESRVI